MPETTAATFCATFVDELVRGGVSDAVVAPGSRSTPLALALVADGRLRVHVHHDERDAGFVALGLGLATGRPAVVVTTSGTAAVELHPAVVEAGEAGVPLLACTADRPPELHGVGAPQTIDQQRLFGRAVRWFVDAGVPDPAMAGSWRSLAAQAVVRASGPPAGPVHVNLPFRDPLVGEAGPRPEGRPRSQPWHLPVVRAEGPPDESLEALAVAIEGRPGVIVAGGRIDDPGGVHQLARAVGWPVIADPRSGCRLPESRTVSHADALLRVPAVADQLRPEVVLRLGSMPASKALARWLADLDAWQVGIDTDGRCYDPDRRLDGVIAAPPGAAAADLAARVTVGPVPAPPGALGELGGSWAGTWSHADAVAAEAIATSLAGHGEVTEPAVARDVVRALPDGARLVVSLVDADPRRRVVRRTPHRSRGPGQPGGQRHRRRRVHRGGCGPGRRAAGVSRRRHRPAHRRRRRSSTTRTACSARRPGAST